MKYERRARLDSGGDEPKMRLEHPLDARRADPALEPVDNALVLHESQRGDGRHAEPVGQVGLLVDIDVHDAQTRAFLAGDVRDQALHPPGRP